MKTKEVSVLFGAGRIGQAIIRRVAAGRLRRRLALHARAGLHLLIRAGAAVAVAQP